MEEMDWYPRVPRWYLDQAPPELPTDDNRGDLWASKDPEEPASLQMALRAACESSAPATGAQVPGYLVDWRVVGRVGELVLLTGADPDVLHWAYTLAGCFRWSDEVPPLAPLSSISITRLAERLVNAQAYGVAHEHALVPSADDLARIVARHVGVGDDTEHLHTVVSQDPARVARAWPDVMADPRLRRLAVAMRIPPVGPLVDARARWSDAPLDIKELNPSCGERRSEWRSGPWRRHSDRRRHRVRWHPHVRVRT